MTRTDPNAPKTLRLSQCKNCGVEVKLVEAPAFNANEWQFQLVQGWLHVKSGSQCCGNGALLAAPTE